MPTVLLSDRGVIEVAGPDAADFLNRLLTNQVPQELAPTNSARLASHAALLTPQGKVLATLFILRHPSKQDSFLLDCARVCLSDLIKRFTLYKLRAACTITDVSAAWHVKAVLTADDAPQDTSGGIAYHDPRHAEMGLRLLSPDPTASDNGPAAYDTRRIAYGLAEDGKDFAAGDVFPHEINLDHTNGLDFHKGCYIGQEVVSRMEHRGTARNRIVTIGFADHAPPPAGCEVRAGGLLLGHTGSVGAKGQGLALLRIDRVAEAQANAQPITAGDTPITVTLPDWMNHA